jgi:Coenzyme PQQ synthesis protein D (PqqD)
MERWLPSSRFQVTSGTLMKSFDDKVALAHMETKRFHLLNPTAALIWRSICAGSSRAEMEQRLRQEFDVDPGELSDDIDKLLTTLRTEDFIHPRS